MRNRLAYARLCSDVLGNMVDVIVITNHVMDQINVSLDTLGMRGKNSYRTIVDSRYGLTTGIPLSLKAAGEKCGLSGSSIGAAVDIAIHKLRGNHRSVLEKVCAINTQPILGDKDSMLKTIDAMSAQLTVLQEQLASLRACVVEGLSP